MVAPEHRRLLTAELLSIGTEITVGDTRDTNAGELARWLTARGVSVLRLSAVPDELLTVTSAFAAALERADLVVSTGGLGPTPDDLTREAIAAVGGESMLRAANPLVATYARADAVDVRISAVADGDRSADDLVETAAQTVLAHLGTYVWSTGETSWSDAVGERLAALGWTLSAVEIGTGDALATLFADL